MKTHAPILNPQERLRQQKEVDACFAPALAMVDELAKLLDVPAEKRKPNLKKAELKKRTSEACDLIRTKLIQPTNSDAHKYLGCLMEGLVQSFLTKGHMDEADLKNELNHFLKGDYELRALLPTGNPRFGDDLYDADNKDTKLISAEGDKTILAFGRGNHLAMFKICELELAKKFQNAPLAKRLAASTARLAYDEPGFVNIAKKGMNAFCDELEKVKYKPFENTKILEFGGGVNSLDKTERKTEFPFIQLFKGYENHTPSFFASPNQGTPGYVSLNTPSDLMRESQQWEEKQKYDYVIAANVACRGAFDTRRGQNESDQHHLTKIDFMRDIVTHLSHMLCDGGHMIISNTASDGVDIRDVGSYPLKITDLGLIATDDRLPPIKFRDSVTDSESGMYVLKRDYGLRPPVVYSEKEAAHERLEATKRIPRSETPPKSYQAGYQKKLYTSKIIDDRDHALNQSWETGF